MGLCGSSMSDEEKEAARRSRALDEQNRKDRTAEEKKIKLLLLGAGESGKSTIFKQMKMLYGVPLTEEERKEMAVVVHMNVMQCMKTLVDHAKEFGLDANVEPQDALKLVDGSEIDVQMTPAIGAAVGALWDDPAMQQVWDRRSEFQLVETHKVYFNDIERLSAEDYIPTQQDILFSRVRTSGIVVERYSIDDAMFEMYDVGGQRNERKKWIHCFDDVTAVIFVAALSEYDQVLFEDASTNRMVEAIELFSDICNQRFFMESSMMLFLNKRDLFEEKIKRKNIADQEPFSDYKGGLDNYDAGVDYFVQRFLSVNRSSERTIYHHVTCATDTRNVEVVFNICKDIILNGNLKDSGFMD